MTVEEAGRRRPALTRPREVLQGPAVRRLLICLGIGVVMAVMSGPQGREDDHTYAIKQALAPSHLTPWLVFGLVLWLVATAWLRYRDTIQHTVQPARTFANHQWTRMPVRRAVYLFTLAIAIVLPLPFDDFWQGVAVEAIGISVLLAIGLNVVVGLAGLLDLGYIAFYAIGAYTVAYFTGALPVDPIIHMNPFFAIPFATLAAMLAGFILGAPTLRLRGDYLAIVTLGFGEIVQILAVNLDSVTNGSRGAFGIEHFSINIGPLHYDFLLKNMPYCYLLLGFTVIVMILFTYLENSRVGRAWTAIREDEVAAQACGIPTVHYKLLAFAIGASTSGFAGVLFASKIGYINPGTFAVNASILVLVLVIFGGMGSLWGSVVGATVIQFALALMLKHNWIDAPDRFMYLGALLVVMMIFRPQGLVPSRRRARELGLAEQGIGGADAMGAPVGSPTT